MQTVLIVIHVMIVIAMVAVILLQRSEGGALGIGGGGGGAGGNLFSARGSANLLTRTTTILAIAFFLTSLGLALLARQQTNAPSLLDGTAPAAVDGAPGDTTTRGTGEGLLDVLQQQSGETPPAPPTDDGPAAAIPAAPAAPAAPQAPTGN